MKSFFKSILFFILLVLLLVGAAYGVLRPEHSSVSAVGPLQVAAYDNGISLYQNFRGEFYTISPFNDYFVSENDTRNSLIDSEELANNSFVTSFAKPSVLRIYESVGNYFGIVTPSISYYAPSKTIDYETKVNKNSVIISKTTTLPKKTVVKKLGTTISFSSGDLIYDIKGNLYTYAPEETLALLKQAYGVTLTPSLNDLTIPVPGKTLYIYSPKVAGVVAIYASKNQNLTINRNAKLIQIEELPVKSNGKYKTSIKISTFENPKEIKNI